MQVFRRFRVPGVDHPSGPVFSPSSQDRFLHSAGSGKFPLVTQGALTGDQLEIFIKAGKVVEAALVAQLFDAEIIFDQQLACVAHPDLDEEPGIGFPGP